MSSSEMDISVPKYRHLSRELKTLIESGHYRTGQQIPTEHELVSQYQVSRNTVRQAISILEEENFLVRRRGAGTFVAGGSDQGQASLPGRPLTSIVVLIVDGNQMSDYFLRQVAAAEKWASEHDIALSVASVETRDLLRGHRPTILSHRHCQGVFLEGWVEDVHCLMLEAMDMPYLVVGNRPISPRFPQFKLDTPALMQRMIDYVRTLPADPAQPVALLIEPLAWHMSKEMLQAYAQIAHELPQKLPLIEMVEHDQAQAGVERLLDATGRPISLVTTGKMLPDIHAVYERRGIDPAAHPVIALTHNFEVADFRHLPFHLMPYGGDSVMIRALPEFVAAYELGHTGRINTSLCPDRVLTPVSPHR